MRVYYPASVVGLVAPQWHQDQRHASDQRLHHGAVTAVTDDRRAVWQHIGVACPPGDRDIVRGGNYRWVHCRAGGDQPAHRELRERVGGPLQQSFLAHDGAAQAHQDQRQAG